MSLLLIPIIGAISNILRGGSFEKYGIFHGATWSSLIFMITVGMYNGYFNYSSETNTVLMNPWILMIIPAYTLGESFGWGRYIGALSSPFFYKELVEVKFIDFLLKWMLPKYTKSGDAYTYEDSSAVVRYAIVALALRGLIWMIPVCAFANHWWLALVGGLLMGPTYYLAGKLFIKFNSIDTNNSLITKIQKLTSNVWADREFAYGAVFWTLMVI